MHTDDSISTLLNCAADFSLESSTLTIMSANITASFESFSDEKFSLGLKIMALVTYPSVVLIGVPLSFGIALFEKNGGDPQKRLLGNQIISFMMYIAAPATSINGLFLTLRMFYGPLGSFASCFFLLDKDSVIGSSQTAVTLMMLFKCLSVFNWRLAAQLNDDFMARFFGLLIFMIGTCCASVTLLLRLYIDESFFVLAGNIEAAFHSKGR